MHIDTLKRLRILKPWIFYRLMEMDKMAGNCSENYQISIDDDDILNFETWAEGSFSRRFDVELIHLIMTDKYDNFDESEFDYIDPELVEL